MAQKDSITSDGIGRSENQKGLRNNLRQTSRQLRELINLIPGVKDPKYEQTCCDELSSTS